MAQATFVVTGTSSGIGLHTAKYLLSRNVRVIGVSRRDTPITHPGFVHVKGDVTANETVEKIVNTAGSQLNGAIFNAGVLAPVDKIADANVEEWKKLYDVNLFSVVLLTSKLLPALRSAKGRAIYVSSGAAVGHYATWSAYGSSKAALNHFVATLAVEEPDVVSVAVAPGVVDTEMQEVNRSTHTKKMNPADAAKFLEMFEKRQLVDPRDSGVLYGNLALSASSDLSGKFARYNDEILVEYSKGDHPGF